MDQEISLQFARYLAPFGDLLFWTALATSVSLWLLLMSPILTLVHETIYKPHLTETTLNQDSNGFSYLLMHIAVLIAALVVFVGDALHHFSDVNRKDSLVNFLDIAFVLGSVLGTAALWKYVNFPIRNIAAYNAHDHSAPYSIPKCWASKLRVVALYFFTLISLIKVYVLYTPS